MAENTGCSTRSLNIKKINKSPFCTTPQSDVEQIAYHLAIEHEIDSIILTADILEW